MSDKEYSIQDDNRGDSVEIELTELATGSFNQFFCLSDKDKSIDIRFMAYIKHSQEVGLVISLQIAPNNLNLEDTTKEYLEELKKLTEEQKNGRTGDKKKRR